LAEAVKLLLEIERQQALSNDPSAEEIADCGMKRRELLAHMQAHEGFPAGEH